MSSDPVRLLDDAGLSESERTLLAAGQSCALVDYDVNAGATRFRAGLAALGAAGVATTVAGSARGATGLKSVLGALGTKGLVALAIPIVGAAAALAVHETTAQRGNRSASATSAAPRSAAVAAVEPSPTTAVGAASPSATVGAAAAPAPAANEPVRAAGKDDSAKMAEPHGANAGLRDAPESHGSHSGVRATADMRAGSVPSAHVVLEETETPEMAEATTASPTMRAERTPEPNRATAANPTSPPQRDEPRRAATPTPTPTAEPNAPAMHPPAPAVTAPAKAPTATNAVDEMRAIVQARDLVARDPNGALAALSAIQRQYPHGYFGEERAALTILALARAGNAAQAKSNATRFLARYPNSPFADKVRAATP